MNNGASSTDTDASNILIMSTDADARMRLESTCVGWTFHYGGEARAYAFNMDPSRGISPTYMTTIPPYASAGYVDIPDRLTYDREHAQNEHVPFNTAQWVPFYMVNPTDANDKQLYLVVIHELKSFLLYHRARWFAIRCLRQSEDGCLETCKLFLMSKACTYCANPISKVCSDCRSFGCCRECEPIFMTNHWRKGFQCVAFSHVKTRAKESWRLHKEEHTPVNNREECIGYKDWGFEPLLGGYPDDIASKVLEVDLGPLVSDVLLPERIHIVQR